MTELKQANFELRKLSNLKNWKDNPRSILKDDFERLKAQILELGVYKTLLVNQDNIVLGGNMRLRAFKNLGFKEVMCGVVETKGEADMLKYALSDNDQAGITDDLKLAEVYHLHPIDTKLYKVQSNNLRPLEMIVNPPDPNAVNEQDEWVGMPDYGEDNDRYRIIINFEDAETRDKFIAEHEIEVSTKGKKTFSTWWPFKQKSDLKSMRIE